jgi:Ca2+-binding RTX toxin-like protein
VWISSPDRCARSAPTGHAISNPDESAADGNGDQQTNPDNPFFSSRPPLVATFTFHGEAVTIIDNHFTSKGGSAPLLGADQPPFDAGEVQRAAQAQAVNSFVDTLLASDANARVIVAGDLNEFQFEEPMQVLKGTATVTNYDVPGTDPFNAVADYTPGGTAVLDDLQDLLPANERYDYVFEGNSETLDHVFVSKGLLNGAQFDIVRINAEFADLVGWRGSDMLNGGNGNDVLSAGAGNDVLTGGNGNDILRGGSGDDYLAGGNGNNIFAFAGGFGHDTVADFGHGDRIEFDGGVFQNFGAVQAASHQVGNDTVITLDAGNSIVLQHVSMSSLHASNFLFA